jgi:2-polyprenyl-3-methyl-5-hydroxy-6-metoxy-1,4-benzoquinol methylase
MRTPLQSPEALDPYGSLEWFQRQYSTVTDDPWGLTWRSSQRLRYQKVLSALNVVERPLTHVLDVGCATGDFTYLLSRHVRGLQTILGVDFVDSAVHRARIKFPHLSFSNESLFALGTKYPKHFDLITCLEVIYYIPKDQREQALRSLSTALRPGGYAVFSSMVSAPPYFLPDEFLDLLKTEFEIVQYKILYLRLISLLEKLSDRALPFLPHDRGVRKYARLPFQAAIAIERWSHILTSLAASHTIALVCPRFEPTANATIECRPF